MSHVFCVFICIKDALHREQLHIKHLTFHPVTLGRIKDVCVRGVGWEWGGGEGGRARMRGERVGECKQPVDPRLQDGPIPWGRVLVAKGGVEEEEVSSGGNVPSQGSRCLFG